MRQGWWLAGALALAGCTGLDGDSGPAGSFPPSPGTATGAVNTCDLGRSCNPIPVSSFPFQDSRDTEGGPPSEIDHYGCAPDTDESGAEWFYAVTVAERGILSVAVDDVSGDDVDIDVHLLADVDPDSCLNRDNVATSWVVEPGTWIAVADTYVGQDGVERSGPYTLTIDFLPLDSGPCAVVPTDVRMFWSASRPGHDCDVLTHTDGVDYPFLHTPSVGPVVKEAHLVTTAEDFGGGWPTAIDDRIDRHYQVTTDASGYAMARTEPWAPSGEGGSEFGQGATGQPVPPEHETWYVNMYWRDRPAKGHRMLLFNPITGAAVVAAGGYETGPGSNESIGGATEEIHDVLGTVHRSEIAIAFAADQTLPFGPIDCR